MIYPILLGIFVLHAIIFFALYLRKKRFYYAAITFGMFALSAYSAKQTLNYQAHPDSWWVIIRWGGIIINIIGGLWLLRAQMPVLKMKMMTSPKMGALFLRIILAYVKFKDKIRRLFKKE